MRTLRLRAGCVAGAIAIATGLLIAGAAPAEAIVGGRTASTSTYPWVIALRTPTVPVSFCGGTLVTPEKVLTAGHCVEGFLGQPSLLHVVAGRDDMRTEQGTEVPVRRIWRDPGYSTFTFEGETGYRNDVAVITLDSPLHGRTLPIARPHQRDLYHPGTWARILGWGTTDEAGSGTGLLRTAHVPVVSDTRCSGPGSYGSAYDARQYVCAGNYQRGGVDTCEFDSGTPLVIDGVVAGITSWGVGCARPHYPGIYTRVTTFSKEIDDQLGDGAA